MNVTTRKLLIPVASGVLLGMLATLSVLAWHAKSERDLYVTRRVNGDTSRIPWRAIGSGDIVLGQLDRPLGEIVMIHGTVRRHVKSGNAYLIVDTVNGWPLVGRTSVDIVGIEEWPEGTEATMSGFEIGTIGPNSYGHPQSISFRFRVHQIFEPTDLAFDFDAQRN